jgi:hypothetical protein
VQRDTSIPIPKILGWSDDASNSVGSEQIIMKHVTGVQLHQKWPHMSGAQKVLYIAALYEKLKEMVDLEFSAYGILYPSTLSLESFSKVALETVFASDLTVERCIGIVEMAVFIIIQLPIKVLVSPC